MSDETRPRRKRPPVAPAPEETARRERKPFALAADAPPKRETSTDPVSMHLPIANNRHEMFAQAIARGESVGRAAQSAGLSATTGSNLLAGDDNVLSRIHWLQQRAAEKSVVTLETLIEELDEARTLAKFIEQPTAMVAATKEKAILLGLRVEKRDTTTRSGDPKGLTDDELAAIARQGGAGADTPPGDPQRPKPVVH